MRELYGDKAINKGQKNDGHLMTAAADWRNPHQTYTNSYNKQANTLQHDEMVDRKFRKAQQLHS